MNTVDLEQQDRSLRAEADALLARHGLLELLRQYGIPHLSGSYAMRLMTWRDLDIYLETPEPETDQFLDLGRRIATALRPRKASYTDHLHFPSTEGVRGLYWGIHTGMPSDHGWKIDLWGVTPDVAAERTAHCDRLAATLAGELRQRALTIKQTVCRHPCYRDTVTSQDVYDAVAIGGAITVEDFWSYKDNRRIQPSGG